MNVFKIDAWSMIVVACTSSSETTLTRLFFILFACFAGYRYIFSLYTFDCNSVVIIKKS